MKQTIKKGKTPVLTFCCDNCEETYKSDEYKVVKGGSFVDGKYVDTTTYVDKCPSCRTKVRVTETEE